jgi:hypothetical protein
MDNHRTYPRFTCSESVEYHPPQEESPRGSLSANISLGGIKLTVHEFVPLGTVLKMQINFSNPRRSVPANGKVMWVREIGAGDRYEIGVEFLREKDTLEKISQVLDDHHFESL